MTRVHHSPRHTPPAARPAAHHRVPAVTSTPAATSAPAAADTSDAPTPPDRTRTMATYIAGYGSAVAAAVIGAKLLKLPVARALPLPVAIITAIVLGLGVGWVEGYQAMKRKTAEYQQAVDNQLNARANEFPSVTPPAG